RRAPEPPVGRAERHRDACAQARIEDLVPLDDVPDRLERFGRRDELTRVTVREAADVEEPRDIERLLRDVHQCKALGHAIERLLTAALIQRGAREEAEEARALGSFGGDGETGGRLLFGAAA